MRNTEDQLKVILLRAFVSGVLMMIAIEKWQELKKRESAEK